MISTTFGIILIRGNGNPIPSITNEEIQKFWKRDLLNGKERDTWQQLMFFISNNSLTTRIQNIENNLQQMGSATKNVLARASRGRPIEDFPHSIMTSLPRRADGLWDMNAKKRINKIDTARRVLKLKTPLRKNEITHFKTAITSKRNREEKIHSRNSNQQTEVILPMKDITNTPKPKPPRKRNFMEVTCTHIPDDQSSPRKVPSPRPSTPTLTFDAERIRMTPKRLFQNQPAGGLSPRHHANFGADPVRQGLTHLRQLKKTQLQDIATTNHHISGDCINALSELIHHRADQATLSTINTYFYQNLHDGQYARAKEYLHPDEKTRLEDITWTLPSSKIKASMALRHY